VLLERALREDHPAQSAEGRARLAAATELLPAVVDAAEKIERAQRIPDDLLSALGEARLFGIFLPEELGGGRVDWISFHRIVEAMAWADGSVGWCLVQQNGVGQYAAWLELETARSLFAAEPTSNLVGTPVVGGTARPVEGGYLVNGRWTYLSGIGHATGAGLAAHLLDSETGEPVRRADGSLDVVRVLVPRAEYRVVAGSWDVVGLLGTMSGDAELRDVFVPDARTYRAEEPRRLAPARTFAGAGLAGGPGLALVALGRAERAFDEFLRLAPTRAKREFVLEEPTRMLGDRPVVQARLAVVLARIMAVREWLYAVIERQQRATAGEASADPELEAAQMQLVRVHAAQEARDCAQAVFDLAGTAAIRSGHPIERAVRDLLTACAHIFLAEPQYEVVGRWIVGRKAERGGLPDAGRLIP